jgi:dual specificity tyrosine-phosphorylation-regulated kinase 2/3/4
MVQEMKRKKIVHLPQPPPSNLLVPKPQRSPRKLPPVLPALRDPEVPPPRPPDAPRRVSPPRPVRIRADVRSQPQYPTLPGAPLDPAEALRLYGQIMTDPEREDINRYREIYYIRQNLPSAQSHMLVMPDFFPFVSGDHIRFQFQQISELGRGAFGSVIKCYDHRNRRIVAIKLIRMVARQREQIEMESDILQFLMQRDESLVHHIVKIYETFEYRSFIGFVFEVLSLSLYDSLKASKFRGLEISRLRSVMRQLANSLNYIHDLGLVHCDVKPENLLWTTSRKTAIKLIDFGCCCFAEHTIFSYIQSRFYRAPEVLLGLPYDQAIDIWSLGCVLCELLTGKPLFPGQNEREQMKLIMGVLGVPPISMILEGSRSSRFFDEGGNPVGRMSALPGSRSLSEILKVDDQNLLLLVRGCLTWDPSVRLTAGQVLRHPWLKSAVSSKLTGSSTSR